MKLILNIKCWLSHDWSVKMKMCFIPRVERLQHDRFVHPPESEHLGKWARAGEEKILCECECMFSYICVYNSPLCEEGLGGFWVTCFRGQVSTLLICGLFHFNTLSQSPRPTHLLTLHPPSSPSCHNRIQVGNLSPLKFSEFNSNVQIRNVDFLIYWERWTCLQVARAPPIV